MKKRVAIITGASSGMGVEFALQMDLLLAGKVDEIWLIARREERLWEVAKLLETRARVIPMDVSDVEDCACFSCALEQEMPSIRMLVNCAGFGLMGAFRSIPIKKQLDMIDVNVRALTRLTYLCIPHMSKNGRILQLASAAAFLPQKNFAVYAATKAYVLSLSRALSQELEKKNIYVTAVCPGPVATEFFEKAAAYGDALAFKEKVMVSSQKVVKKALRDSAKRKQVSVCSLPMQAFYLLTKLVPHKLIFFVMRFLK